MKTPLLLLPLLAISLPAVSCHHGTEPVRHPVKPTSPDSTIPWNPPVPGQGGGALGAMRQTPRR